MTDQTLETRDKNASTMNRRETLKSALATGLAVAAGGKLAPATASEMVNLPFGNGERPLVAYPGKRPLIVLTSRPPQLETPFSVFDEGVFTPNDAFFVRYHLADIPLKIDPDAFRLTIQGKVDAPLSLSLDELKGGFEPVDQVIQPIALVVRCLERRLRLRYAWERERCGQQQLDTAFAEAFLLLADERLAQGDF